MKKYLILLAVAISTSAFVGCSSDDETEGFNYVTFEADAMDLVVEEFGSQSREVTVYTGNVTDSDRTFSINVDPSSTLSAESYSIPETVTVPGGTNEATFNIEITDTNLPTSGSLVLRLEGENDVFTGDALAINTTKLCEFDPAGSFINNSGFYEAEFPVEVEAGAGANEYVAKGLFAEGMDITFTVNEDLSVTVPAQGAWSHADYGVVSVESVPGSRAQPCDGSITLVLNHFVSAGTFGEYAEVLTKQADGGGDTDGGDDTDGEDGGDDTEE